MASAGTENKNIDSLLTKNSTNSTSDEINEQATKEFKVILVVLIVILLVFMAFFVYNLIKCYLPKWRNRRQLVAENDVEMGSNHNEDH